MRGPSGRCRAAWTVLGIVAIVCCGRAVGSAGAVDRTSAPATASTPVFSARRVPALVQSIAAAPSLRTEMEAIVAASPVEMCVDVGVDGRTLFSHAATAPLIPASTQKIVTAQLALDVLGSTYRFRTDVGGVLGEDGVVDGDLFLVGGGDPVLRTDAYDAYFGDAAGDATSIEALADAVVARGVRHVTGSVVGDESRYDTERMVPTWPDRRYLEQHQIGPLSALDVDQGFVSFPETRSDEGLAQLEAASDPPAFAASVFADLLRARGVRIDGPPRSAVRPPGAPSLAHVESPPLTEIVAQLLNRSDNQIAELLVKEAGFVDGDGGTTAAGLAVFADAFGRLGVPAEGVRMHDGSGLGYDNRITCGLLTALLDRAGPRSDIADGLAVAGISGTLRDRFTDPELKGRIRAKTGSLNEVTALAGFADPTTSPALGFAYIANGAVVTDELLDVQEDLGAGLLGYAAEIPVDRLGPR